MTSHQAERPSREAEPSPPGASKAGPLSDEATSSPFVYQSNSQRVVFAWGAARQVAAEVERLGRKRVLVIASEAQSADASQMLEALAPRVAGVFARAAMHTPVEVTEQALEMARAGAADLLLAIGGGSATGLSKALAARLDLAQVILPTTYAGSEMTPILGETERGVKTTRRDPRLLPAVVIYDPALTVSLPLSLSVSSALNAMAHAVEALYARDRNPVISLLAEEGIRALSSAIPRLLGDVLDREGRASALYGAWLCGMALGSVEMALHHKLCHVLGGSFNLPHAETHAVLLPQVVAFNRGVAVVEMARVARALHRDDAATGLFDLVQDSGLPCSLRELGMPLAGIESAAELALKNAYWNPRPYDQTLVRQVLTDAWHGRRPSVAVVID